MKKNWCVFTLLLLTLSPLATADQGTTDSAGASCRMSEEFLKTPITTDDILLNLFVNFKHTDQRGQKIKFKAKPVTLKDGVITFEDPRFNGSAISDFTTRCIRSRKNFIGYEVCQEQEVYSAAADLCQQLGLAGVASGENAAVSETVSSNREPYSFKLEAGKWHRLRLSSALAPRIRFTRLKSLSCRVD